jgi:hypothetical protein
LRLAIRTTPATTSPATRSATNLQALNVNAGAVAYSVLHFGMTTQDINGKRGKGNFKRDGYKPDHWGPHAIK